MRNDQRTVALPRIAIQRTPCMQAAPRRAADRVSLNIRVHIARAEVGRVAGVRLAGDTANATTDGETTGCVGEVFDGRVSPGPLPFLLLQLLELLLEHLLDRVANAVDAPLSHVADCTLQTVLGRIEKTHRCLRIAIE